MSLWDEEKDLHQAKGRGILENSGWSVAPTYPPGTDAEGPGNKRLRMGFPWGCGCRIGDLG